MNFLNLHYFLVTAEEMSITRAAKRLFISQQALSAHISNLEKEYGVPLFDRSPSFSLIWSRETADTFLSWGISTRVKGT